MLREAINEIRLHASRFVATLAAIAISIGFVAAISTLVGTEQQGTARSNQPALSQADIVILGAWDESLEVAESVGALDGVAAVEPAVNQLLMLEANERSVWASVLAVPSAPFRWSEVTEGRWPGDASELAVSREAVEQLGVGVGDSVVVPGQDIRFDVVGVTNDPKSLYSVIAFTDAVGPEGTVESSQGIWVVDVADREVAAVIADVESALGEGDTVEVMTGEAARQQALNDLTAYFDVFRNLLLGFAGIALIVGMIIIANTFTILVAQRRRQIGLLRAVGASSMQVRGRLVVEAVILGLVGSILGVGLGVGVAAIASVVTGSLFWGLVIDWGELGLAVALGVVVTVASVVAPAFTASRVPPLEALNPVPTGRQERRLGVVRSVASLLFLLGGAALVWLSRVSTDLALVWAIAAGGLLTFGVLLAAPLYVPSLSRGLARVLGSGRPTMRLAGENTARNPRRAGATAVALMLAVGLIVTLQVGLATVRSSAMEAIESEYPIDVSVSAHEPLETAYVEDLRAVPSTARLVAVESRTVEVAGGTWTVRDVNTAGTTFGIPEKDLVSDGAAIAHPSTGLVGEVELPTATGTTTLAVTESVEVPIDTISVPSAVFDQLPGEVGVREVWIELTDTSSPTAFNQVTTVIDGGPVEQVVEGAAVMVGILTQVVNVILVVMTALLGVAVLIALVGVGNTLGLSVIERQRESALLRALGMQRSSLRLMLLLEALLLASVGVVVGVAAGAFFGWLGVSSALLMMPAEARFDIVFSVDPWWTMGLIAVCLLAAALASVLPGRRAANATPTEALAID